MQSKQANAARLAVDGTIGADATGFFGYLDLKERELGHQAQQRTYRTEGIAVKAASADTQPDQYPQKQQRENQRN